MLDLLRIAEQNNLLILEMLYQFHSSFKIFQKMVEQELENQTNITISFAFQAWFVQIFGKLERRTQ